MSDRKNHRRGEKPLFKKSHVHKPKRGKGHYKRKGKRNLKQVPVEQILEKNYEDL